MLTHWQAETVRTAYVSRVKDVERLDRFVGPRR